MSVFLVGTGVVGRALLEIVSGRTKLVRINGVRPPSAAWVSGLQIAGVANRRGFVSSADEVPALLSRRPARSPYRIGDATLDALAKHRDPVLVDATAAEDMTELYLRAHERGIRVVSANKKPFAGRYRDRARLFAEAGWLRYSATVGAGLPIIETLQDLVRKGDRVRLIDCVLSGTLGFIGKELARKTPLSRAIAIAKERGYTEPDPREDPSGNDVARKLVILARELGARTSVSDVALSPFIPTHVSLDAQLDAKIAARVARLEQRGLRLVYLARIVVGRSGVRASASPTAVPASHPAASLAATRALAAFTTAAHRDRPIVVSGSRAGGAVTASAILADVARLISSRQGA